MTEAPHDYVEEAIYDCIEEPDNDSLTVSDHDALHDYDDDSGDPMDDIIYDSTDESSSVTIDVANSEANSEATSETLEEPISKVVDHIVDDLLTSVAVAASNAIGQWLLNILARPERSDILDALRARLEATGFWQSHPEIAETADGILDQLDKESWLYGKYDIEAAVHSWLAQPGSFTPWLAPQTDTEHEVELTEDEIARNEDFLESKSRATGWT